MAKESRDLVRGGAAIERDNLRCCRLYPPKKASDVVVALLEARVRRRRACLHQVGQADAEARQPRIQRRPENMPLVELRGGQKLPELVGGIRVVMTGSRRVG